MNKNEFIKKLKHGLSGLPEDEVVDIVSDYEDHFIAGASEGRTESEIASGLGDPNQIARQMTASNIIKKAEKNISFVNISRAIFATAGLGFINLVFVIWPYLAIVGFILGLLATGIGIISVGVVTVMISIFSLFNPDLVGHYVNLGLYPAAGLFMGISASTFGLLFIIGWGYLVKWFYILTVKYLKLNVKIITGEKK